MAINFRQIAQRETVISEVMEGRQKVDKTNGVVTIVDFDIVTKTDGEVYAICAINDHQFINGGHILTKIFTAIAAEYDGDIDRARNEFKESGGLTVKLEKTKTKSGRSITKVEVQ